MTDYKVYNNILIQKDCFVRQEPVVNKSIGRNICDFVIIHFTGSPKGIQGDIEWAKNPNSKVSFHLLVDKNGTVIQCANFREITWHAGVSQWKSTNNKNRIYKNLNKYSIGIEIDNVGQLFYRNGKFFNAWNKEYDGNLIYHNKSDNTYWEAYTQKQLDTVFKLSLLLANTYSCVDILGHNDISPGRKIDPGPAFPMNILRNELRKQKWYKFK